MLVVLPENGALLTLATCGGRDDRAGVWSHALNCAMLLVSPLNLVFDGCHLRAGDAF